MPNRGDQDTLICDLKLKISNIVENNSRTITYRPKSSKSRLVAIKSVKFIPQNRQIMIKKTSLYYVSKWSICARA